MVRIKAFSSFSKTPWLRLAAASFVILAILIVAGCSATPPESGEASPSRNVLPGEIHAKTPASVSQQGSDKGQDSSSSQPAPESQQQTEGIREEPKTPSHKPSPKPDGVLTVHYIDVGQGDATLLRGPDFTILIDTGDYRGNEVVPYLQGLGVERIDLLILTHPHADHIGQVPQVMDAFVVSEVWMSGNEQTTRTFERALDAILASDAGYHEPQAGEKHQIGSIVIEVIHPSQLTGDLNNDSISVRIAYGDVAFLFTGDAEESAERAMLQRGHVLRADILHLGHHGSNTSSTADFLQAVNPSVAIYSAGAENPYGHPHTEVIDRIRGMGIELYGTDTHGTIRVKTDGTNYTVETGHNNAPSNEPSQADRNPTPDHHTAELAEKNDAEVLTACIDINRATFEELQSIIHIGPVRAQEIIDLRAVRPFQSVDDLTRIRGIGPARLTDIKKEGVACVR